MRTRGAVVLVLCCGAACGGQLAPSGGDDSGGDESPSSDASSPLGDVTLTPLPGVPPSCSGDVYVVLEGDECPLPCSGPGYALCDGTRFRDCSCVIPAGWTEVSGEDAGVGAEDGGSPSDSSPAWDGDPVAMSEPVVTASNGYVSPDYPGMGNTVGVTGSWYAYGDGWGTEEYDGGVGAAGERGSCEFSGGFSVADCSSITSPLPPSPIIDGGGVLPGYADGFPATPQGSQTRCLSGTGAKVIAQDGGTSPDYSDIWGIGIGFDFNNVNGVKMAYDAPAHHVIGVQFTLSTGGAFPPLRVEFQTTDTVSPGGSNDPYDMMPSASGTYQVLWSGLEAPYPAVVGENISYLPASGVTQPAFNPAHLLSIQFHVPTNTAAPIAVTSLCVSNLTMLIGVVLP